MTKDEAASIFGGTQAAMARALGLTRGAVAQWPIELTDDQIDRIVGAATRMGLHLDRVPPRRQPSRET